LAKKKDSEASLSGKRRRWSFPRATLEQALKIPYAIKNNNGGNPWETDQTRKAVGAGGGNPWFYLTAASRDYGLTTGTRDTATIALADLGREIVYAPNADAEKNAKLDAFLNVEIFRRVLEYYKGSNLPEMKYLGNTLEKQFGLSQETHEEFSRTFRENCQYLGITSGVPASTEGGLNAETGVSSPPETITLAEGSSALTAFVIMPFVERDAKHSAGFFAEVLRSIVTPAAKASNFTVKTANRQGSDLIQSTIINDLMDADLVIADLTEHNPNVLFELGMRMAEDKPVVLIKAEGTGPLFDVDNMLRVFEYNPNLWQTTVEKDMPNLRNFSKGAWDDRVSEKSYMKILRATKSKT
jgi:hypothetical protein